MGKFVISMRSNGEFQFNLKAGNGEIILTSEGYTTKAACKNGIKSVRVNAIETALHELNTSVNDKFYFNLKAANNQIIGTSQMYVSAAGRDSGIASVMQNAQDSVVEDTTVD